VSGEQPKGLAPVSTEEPDERVLPVFVVPGSIDRGRLSGLLERAVPEAAARLHGYRRVELAGMDWPVLVAAPGHTVAGSVLLALDREALRRLDAYRGVREGLYRRVAAPVTIAGRDSVEPVFIYLPTERTLRRLASC
jgi:gamma-glutamylcyclotransferase (GGCT)/AIG2-like uncharacterized protein YtfP